MNAGDFFGLPAGILENEFGVPIDDTHVALGSPQHVAEGAARTKQEAPQPGDLQRQGLGHLDAERFARVFVDCARHRQMLVARHELHLAVVS
jgi:hypothetical protein